MTTIKTAIEQMNGRKLGHVQEAIVRDIQNNLSCQFRDYYGKCQSKGYSQACLRWKRLAHCLNASGVAVEIIPGVLGGTWTSVIKPIKTA